jgi:hypothetical protein
VQARGSPPPDAASGERVTAAPGAYTVQVMSCPQHMGDFTLPWPPGHSETWTEEPSAFVSVEWTSSFPHCPHVIEPMLIPHFSHL